MASLDTDTHKHEETGLSSEQEAILDNLVEAVSDVTLQNSETASTSASGNSSRPLRVYTRLQVLHLRKSPLVKPPDGMPALKDWFGDWNEQQVSTKKDTEPSTTSTTARERRFRRDAEDGDAPRPSFRSTLSQPSQMGNFRHQSLRTTDREKEKDSERERERDLRDKEGQERLRNLSDKYDRERLALSSSTNNLRNKERDSAPHLASNASNRLGQAQNSSTATRRNEGREPSKRKVGESSEDWRRGPDVTRTSRDDRSDNSRRDRDNRERPRSRVRDSSRVKRDPSSSRRDEKDKARDRRGDGDRDEHRRDKDDYPRRDRDDHHRREWDDFYNRGDRDRDDHYQRDGRDKYRPRDAERESEDDPRRWRDDGRRDERIVARRDRERPWERHEDRDRDRPNTSDDRDARPRRGVARERRSGAGDERDDRRDRERDREAEPAWMETYVPSTPGGGILGGQSGDGELDGIQAWKKGMKEKEQLHKENDLASLPTKKTRVDQADSSSTLSNPTASSSEAQLDEIQLFKLMMKREAEKKEGDKSPSGLVSAPSSSTPTEGASSIPMSEQAKVHPRNDDQSASIPGSIQRDVEPPYSFDETSKRTPIESPVGDPQRNKPTATPNNGSQSLLSALVSSTSSETSFSSDVAKPSTPSLDQSLGGSRLFHSRVMPGVSPPGFPSSTTQNSDKSPDSTSSAPTFNPPPGSRLLAFGSRVPSSGSAAADLFPSKSNSALDPSISHLPPPGVPALNAHKLANVPSAGPAHQAMPPDTMPAFGVEPHFSANVRHTSNESSRVLRSFSPHGHVSSVPFEEARDGATLGQLNDLRRTSAVERAAFGLPNEPAGPFGDLGGPSAGGPNMSPSGSLDLTGSNIPGGANYATGKGSRFAKFFDTKTRDGQPPNGRKIPGMSSMPSSPPQSDPRQAMMGLNGMIGANGDTRTMEDIFAMLQNSAQNHRVSPQIPPTGRMPSGGSPYGQNHTDMHNLQQHIHPQQHFPQNSHLDSLYDSRFDDRNFVPDGMVPGLRPAPPRSRSREPSGVLFNEQLDDPLHFNVRLQQQRNLEQMYSGPSPAMYTQQQNALLRNGGMPLQQQHFRGGPSPIANQNTLSGPAQRLPPGLANLGGRPPHDPSQYLGAPMGGMGGGLQGGLHGNSPTQQGYNNFGNGGGLGFGAGPHARGPVGPQGPLGMGSVSTLGSTLGLQNNVDLRGVHQAQLLAMGGVGVGGGLRGQGPGFGPQHVPSGQPSVSHLAMRQQQQQQQQQLPPHMMPHMLPPHLQSQQGLSGGNAQGAQDLMALLMGGHRD